MTYGLGGFLLPKLRYTAGMPVLVTFASHLQRHVSCPPQEVTAGTLAQVLAASFLAAPTLRHYVLDDQGLIRKHVAVFINGVIYHQRQQMQTRVEDGSQILVVQALSGG